MQVSFSLPENSFFSLSQDKAEKKIRLYAALGMYQAQEISIGAACELAGVDRYTFLDICKQAQVTVQTLNPDELETEFAQQC